MLNSNDPSPIFKPVNSNVTSIIQRDELSLHTTFWVNGNKTQEVHVVLSTDHLAIC